MATQWSDEETLKLIDIWSEDSIQAMLEGARQNKDVFLKISREMEMAGFKKTADQCSSKIKKLRFEYRKIKDKNGKTGRGRNDWKFFEAMDQVLGHKPATKPPVLIESGDVTRSEENSDTTVVIEDAQNSSLEKDCMEESESSRSRSATPVPEEKNAVKNCRKRPKPSNNFEKIEGWVEKMLKMQEDSDKKFMKLEERMLEMEERRHKDNTEMFTRMMAFMSSSAGPTVPLPQHAPPYRYNYIYSDNPFPTNPQNDNDF